MPSPPASSPPPTSPPFVSDRFVLELRPVRGLTPLAARAFCKAQDLLGLVFARATA